ncbi:MAG: site-specific integrase [Acidobacteria bacterium]|nr:site-specific integrase [Acidobacteriota bacterium]
MAKSTHDALSDPQVKTLAAGSTPIDVRDGAQRGLILTVFPTGRKVFSVRYVYQGKHRRLVLGEYPKLTLAKARDAAGRARQQVLAGGDPAGARQQAKAKPADTVAALITEYLEEHASGKRSAGEDRRMLEKDVLPVLGERAASSLTRRDIKALMQRIKRRGAPVSANRALAVLRKMLNYAIDADSWSLDANPAARVAKYPETERERVLTDDEIRRLWRCLGRFPTTAERPAPRRKGAKGPDADPICPVAPSLAATLKVRLLTGQRGAEVAQMRWCDLELDGRGGGVWTIPASVSKNKKSHRLPLTADVLTLIEAQRPTDDDGHVLETDPDAYVFSRDGAATVAARAKKAASKLSGVLGFAFTGHDLRRTAATGMGNAGVSREVIGLVLNHAELATAARSTRIYDRAQRDREKLAALQAWERRLRGILKGKPATGDVLTFGRGA